MPPSAPPRVPPGRAPRVRHRTSRPPDRSLSESPVQIAPRPPPPASVLDLNGMNDAGAAKQEMYIAPSRVHKDRPPFGRMLRLVDPSRTPAREAPTASFMPRLPWQCRHVLRPKEQPSADWRHS